MAPAAQAGEAKGGRRWLPVLTAALAVAGLYALLGFVVAPRVAQGQLVERLAAQLGRPVAIGRVEFNPFTLVLRVHDFSVSGPAGGDGELAGFARLEVDASWRSLYRLAPVLSSVTLHRPRVHLARDAAGRYGIQDLVDKWAARPPAESGPTPRFSVANIVVDEGRFVFDDGKLGVRQELSALALHLPFVSSLPVDEEVWVEPKMAASINGAPFELAGRSLPFGPARDSSVDIELEGVDLTRFAGYSPVSLPVQLQAGRLDAALKIAFSQPAGSAPEVAVSGSVKLASLDVRQPDGSPLVAAESVAADAIALAWPQNRHAIGRVTISEPRVALRRKVAERRFLERVLETAAKSAATQAQLPPQQRAPMRSPGTGHEPASTGAGEPQWRIDEIVVNGGRLAFEDAQFEPRPLQLEASALDATMRQLSSDPAVPARFELAADLASGERVSVSGAARWQEGAADAKLQVSELALKQWWWIVGQRLAIDALDGTLSVGVQVHAAQGSGGTTIRFDEGTARLRNLSLRQRWDKRTLLTLPELDIEGVSVDPGKREVSMGALTARGANLLVRRDEDARFNLQRLVIAGRDAGGSAGAAPEPASAAGGAGAAAPDWTVSVDELAIGGFGVDLEDQRGGKAASLRASAIEIGASGFSSADRAPPAKVRMRARVDRRGTLSVSGDIGVRPLSATLRVAARELAIVPLQPYFTGYVNALVSSGTLSADGSLRLAVRERSAPHVAWKGQVSVAGFSAASKEANDDLLRWKSLAFDAIDFDSGPPKVEVGGITLEDFHARVILNAEGRLNLREWLVDRQARSADEPTRPAPGASGPARGADAAAALPEAPDVGESASPAPQRQLRVGGVRLVDGNIDFSDFFVKPNYSANLTGMNGQISQITPGRAGDLELRGRIDRTGNVEILGKVNPLADPLYLDLTASAGDIDLPRLSPYSGKYVGYGIEKGKLSAKVAYKVENRQLSAENHIVLDQLTFGDKVESADALKLPVLFAVSLLKDRNGVIDVNLPVSGSLDDPQFSVGGIVIRIIVNLVVRAVTAPFALIANLAGADGAELSWVGFEPGSPELGASALEKLRSIARALTQRPGLKLDLAGRADPAADRDALRRLALERAVKAQKLKETAGGGGDVAAIDRVQVDAQEYPEYLERAWRAAKFDKPRNAIGLVKSQPVAEMERMMLAHIDAGDAGLVALANERAQHVKDWLVESGKVPGERVFIVAPRLGAGEASAAPGTAAPGTAAYAPRKPGATAPLSRVDLSLK